MSFYDDFVRAMSQSLGNANVHLEVIGMFADFIDETWDAEFMEDQFHHEPAFWFNEPSRMFVLQKVRGSIHLYAHLVNGDHIDKVRGRVQDVDTAVQAFAWFLRGEHREGLEGVHAFVLK